MGEVSAPVRDIGHDHTARLPQLPRQDASTPRTIGEAIRAHADARPTHPAIVGSDFGALSYRTLQEEIDGVRLSLRDAGIESSASIAIAIANTAQAARAIIAVSCSAASVPIDPKLTATELERCWDIVRPSAVVVLRGVASAARTSAEERGLLIIEADLSFGLSLKAARVGVPAPYDDPDPDEPAFILQTSGTTDKPNLVPFSHRNMLSALERLRTWFKLTSEDCCLSVTPVYYSHALTTAVFPTLMTGGSLAFPSAPTNVDLVEWFTRLNPTWYSAGPTLHLSVMEKAEQLRDERPRHRLRFVSSAGAPLTRELFDRMQSTLGVPVLEHYGSSETAQIASNLLPPSPAKFGTCGVPWPEIIKIASEDGRPLPAGQQGVIFVRGASVMAGYVNAPERNATIFVDGWYRTGDIGSLDADGFLTLHGREKELINRGGEKISPGEIDRALLRHPQVAQAAACAVPHPRLGEDVGAAVVLQPGATVTSGELREFVSSQLAPFKVPRRIAILDALPKGTTGKVQRRRLSELLQADAGRARSSDEGFHIPLVQLWKRVLKRDSIRVDDDFFELGGDSLLAMDVGLELQQLIGRELSESLLFEAPTIRDLAKRLASELNRPV